MKRYFYLLLLLLISTTVFAQRDSIPLTTIAEKTAGVNSEHPVEKIYLHFDKPYYAVGDTIWFKAYVTMDVHQPSALSKVVNVEVISPKDSVVESLKLPITNSVGSGRVVLNGLNYKQGNYRIRAYTNWMLNFKLSYMYDKTITIGSALNKDVNTQISYRGSLADKSSKLGARILYKGKDGAILADKRVEWRVETNGDVVARGRGNTDAQGYLDVSIGDNKIENAAGSSLITSIEMPDKKLANSSFPLKNAFNGVDLQFFPEGGLLIAGINSQVAFKAIGTNGLGVDVKGTIVDGQGTEVAKFASSHLGMGKTQFIPQPNTSYKALAEFANGTKATYLLPRVVSNGITLAVNNLDPQALILQVAASDDFYRRNQNRMFYLVAQTGGFIVYAAQTRLSAQTYSATIPKSKFKTGVVQLSLMSSAGDPLSERLIFINHDDNLNLALTSDKPAYTGGRGHVMMKLSAKQAAAPVEGNFSVSVIDESKVPFKEDNENTILTYLLLTSDITGYVEQPNYYFNHPDIKKATDLDLLMMTQGFRWFDMYDVVAGKVPRATLPPEQGIDLSGTLRKLNGIPVFKGVLRLIIPDKNFSAETTTDADGNFVFRNVTFTDSSKITISARNNVDARNLKITMNGGLYPAIGKSESYGDEIVNIDSTLNTYVQNSEKQYKFNQILKEVVVKSAPARKPKHEQYTALTGLPMVADHEIGPERLTGCNNFLMCIQGQLTGLTFDNNNFYITRAYNQGSRTPVQFYVRGLQVDVNFLNSINPAEVESIEVFLNDGVSGINRMTNTAGIVSINMKQAPKGTPVKVSDLSQLFPDQNTVTFSPKGYVKAKQFYSPKYLVTKTITTSDLRTTIYWNPAVVTDKTGLATFDFYNADSRGTYKAIVEGIDKDGNIGRAVYRYTVK